ncbi:MAG TPA: hypothetical protein VGK53_18350 [Propionicimonas sp.]|jgi:hypothetical protein
MYVMPHTRIEWVALLLLLPVLLYPLYWSVFLLIPDSLRGVSIAVVAGLGVLALASLVAAGVAIFGRKERSVLLIAVAIGTIVLIALFAVGEAIGH